MKFGAWLKAFLHKNDIKSSQLCKVAGFHTNLLYWWMSNRNLPSGYSIALLSTALSQLSGIDRPIILEEMVKAILKHQ